MRNVGQFEQVSVIVLNQGDPELPKSRSSSKENGRRIPTSIVR